MSLINKVLKDVEKKRRQTQQNKKEGEKILIGLSAPKSVGHRHHWSWNVLVLFVILIILLILLLYFYWPLDFSSLTQKITRRVPVQSIVKNIEAVTIKSASMIQPVKIPAPNDISKPQSEPTSDLSIIPVVATLNNVFVASEGKQNMIDFRLDKPTHYYLDHHDSVLRINLMNTQCAKPFAPNLKSSFVKGMTVRTQEYNTIIELSLIPHTEIRSLQYQGPNLQLVLYNDMPIETLVQKEVVPPTKKQAAEQQYFDAIMWLQKQKKDFAILALKNALALYPEGKTFRELLATLLIDQGQFSFAQQILFEGLKQNQGYLPFVMLQARMLTLEGNIPAAIHVLEQKAPSIQSDTNYYVLLAALYRQNNQYLEAARVYNDLTKINATVGVWWVGLGISLESLNQKNTAKEAYSQALLCEDLTPQIRAFVSTKISP